MPNDGCSKRALPLLVIATLLLNAHGRQHLWLYVVCQPVAA